MELEPFLKEEFPQYSCVTEIPGRGVCGIDTFVNTIGLHYGLDADTDTYKGCYSYYTMAEAIAAISSWNGIGDPPGNWKDHFDENGLRFNPAPNDEMPY
jgi:hypothetical protein